MALDKMKELEKRIEVILAMWDNHTLEEIGDALGTTKQRVAQIVNQLRKHGVDVPSKKGYWEIVAEKYKR